MTYDRWLYEPTTGDPVIRSVFSDLRHSRQATLMSQITRAHCSDATVQIDVLQAMSSDSAAELYERCENQHSGAQGGQTRRVPRDASRGSSSDSDSTDSFFQQDAIIIGDKLAAVGQEGRSLGPPSSAELYQWPAHLLASIRAKDSMMTDLNLDQVGRWCRDRVRLQRHGMHGAGSGVVKLFFAPLH